MEKNGELINIIKELYCIMESYIKENTISTQTQKETTTLKSVRDRVNFLNIQNKNIFIDKFKNKLESIVSTLEKYNNTTNLIINIKQLLNSKKYNEIYTKQILKYSLNIVTNVDQNLQEDKKKK